jgi:type VI secretion system secreted protein Hcp
MASAPNQGGGGKDCILTFENFVTGECNDADAKIKDGVELLGFTWGVQSPRDAASGAATGAARFEGVRCTATTSRASPQLFQASVENQRIRSAVLHVRKQGAVDKSGKSQGEYYTVTLKDVAVTSYRSAIESVADSPIPVDEFTLNYAQIELSYRQQTDTGALGGVISYNASLLLKRQ